MSSAPCSSTRSTPTGTGSGTSAATTSSYGEFGENLTVDGLPDDEVCIGDRYRIGEAEFEVTQPRVTCYRVGHARSVSPRCPRCWSATTGPASTCGSSPRATSRPATGSSRPGPGRDALTVADTDALLYLPGRDPAKLRAATRIPALSPGWQESFRDCSRPPRTPARPGNGRRAGVDRVPAAPRDRGGPRDRVRLVDLPELGRDGAPLPAARAGQYLTLRIPGAAGPAPVRSYSLSSAPGADSYRISVKHEPHGDGQRLPDHEQRASRRRPRRGGAPRRLRPRPRRPGRSCSSRPASASPRCWPCCTSSRPNGATARSGGSTAPADRASTRWPTRRHDLLDRPAARRTSTCSGAGRPRRNATRPRRARPSHEGRAGRTRRPGRRRRLRLRARPPSWPTSGRPSPRSASNRPASTPSCSARCRRSTPASTEPATRHPTSRPVRPEPARWSPSPAAASPPRSPPAHGSVLELAEACDVPTRWSCRTGVCHTCVTPLLSGDITYTPDPLEPPPDGQVLICCARPDDRRRPGHVSGHLTRARAGGGWSSPPRAPRRRRR